MPQFISLIIMFRQTLLVTLVAVAFAGAPNRMWDDDCGKSHLGKNAFPEGGHIKGQRVVGGWEAIPNSIPWMVHLLYKGSFFCGGSIVTDRHIITAAHCVAGDQPSDLEVRVGAHSRVGSTEYDVKYQVTKVDYHPDYDLTGNIENDVAVLTVEEMTLTEGYVSSICPPVDDKSKDHYSGRDCHTSGWGTTNSGGSTSDLLLYTNMEVTSYQTCVDTHPNGWVQDGMLCAGRPEHGWDRDACQGDSGGPLYLWEEEDGDDDDEGAWTLIGQVSWGIGCAGLTPGVYADTAFYVDYFNYIINGF